MTNNKVLEKFEQLMSKPLVFLDTETTGLGDDAEVCEIAIVDYHGEVLFDTLIKPTAPIPPGATNVHHITNEMVRDAKSLRWWLPELREALENTHLCVYNADYDLKVMHQSARANNFSLSRHMPTIGVTCIMKLYADYWGDWNEYHQSNTYQSLGNAAKQQSITLPRGMKLHRARADAELTRVLTLQLGGYYDDEIPF
jgi:DNA polymerase III subunit epsilon